MTGRVGDGATLVGTLTCDGDVRDARRTGELRPFGGLADRVVEAALYEVVARSLGERGKIERHGGNRQLEAE